MFGTYTQQLLIFMNKKEKYINFIVNDLIKKTIIEGGFIEFPFPTPLECYRTDLGDPQLINKGSVAGGFVKYVMDRYGVIRDEVDDIWEDYEEIIMWKLP